MLCNKISLFTFLALFLLPTLFSKCLLYDVNQCHFCSFDTWNPDLNLSFFGQNNVNSSGNCLAKNYTFIQKKIVVLANGTKPNAFDLTSSFYECDIIFYLSNGSHFILNNDFIIGQNIFFKRMRIRIQIQPLFCSEYDILGLCASIDERPIILVKSIKFTFYISGVFTMRNIAFDAIESIYENVNEECLSNTNEACCLNMYDPNDSFCN